MRGRKKAFALLLAGLLWLYGCGDPSPGPEVMTDTGEESGPDASDSDTGEESGLDASDFDTGEESDASDSGMREKSGPDASDSDTKEESDPDISDSDTGGELVYEKSTQLRYAENFAVDHYEGGYVLLTITMDGTQLLIVPENGAVPQALDQTLDKEPIILRRPVRDIYLAASSAMDFFDQLDGLDSITFSGQKEEGWFIASAREAMQKGSILYAGKYSRPDYELLVSDHCALAIENRMISHSPEVVENLESFGIPVITDYSSYEPHPLGRAEWVKFYGALLGKEEEAEKIFKDQEAMLKKVSASERTDQTAAFFFITSNGLVQVRQSSDYIPKMIELAGGTYIFEDLGDPDTKRSTMNMQAEEFYAGAKDADHLIYNSSIDGGVSNVQQLLDKCGLLEDFKAVRNGNVWCTTNDFYQQPLAAGYFIEDIHRMLQGEKDAMHYLYHLD